MDINPQAFTAPWSAHEFANHILDSKADLAIVCMAWLSHELTQRDVDPEGPEREQPWMESLGYWCRRFGPVVGVGGGGGKGGVKGERRDEGENLNKTILVLANRTGIEGPTCFAGSSSIMRVGGGKVEMWGFLGRAEEGCLVVDTEVVSFFFSFSFLFFLGLGWVGVGEGVKEGRRVGGKGWVKWDGGLGCRIELDVRMEDREKKLMVLLQEPLYELRVGEREEDHGDDDEEDEEEICEEEIVL